MEEAFDRLLIRKIKEVFDRYEDPSSEEGWAELRKIYPPRKNRRPLILWISSAAAILLVVSGLWFIQPVTTSTIQTKEEPAISKTGKTKPGTSGDTSKQQKTENQSAQPLAQQTPVTSGSAATFTPRPTVKTRQKERILYTNPQLAAAPQNKISLPLPEAQSQTDTLPQIQSPAKAGRPANASAPVSILKGDTTAADPAAQNVLATANTQPATDAQLTGNEEPPRRPGNKKKEDRQLARVGFSVFAGSYFNYAEGSGKNNLNFGAGVVSDIPVAKNLKLSAGLSIAKNTLDYTNQLPDQAASEFSSVAYDRSSTTNLSFLSSNYNTVTGYQADLLALDVPINLKYLVIPKSNRLYISAGLSSGAFLNEKYTYQYQTFNTASFAGFAKQPNNEEIDKRFNSFNFARTLNVSFGLSTNLGKTQNITFEPFLKHPLGDLGSQNLRFGAAGINLKLNFNPQKN